MANPLRGVAKRAARAVGLEVGHVDSGCYVVQRRPARRAVVPVGPPVVGAHLLVSEEAVDGHPGALQKHLSRYLAQQQVRWLLRETGVDLVLDVGANVGQFALGLRASGYTGRIVSFEPVRAAYDELARAAERDPDWEVRPYALADVDGTASINTRPGTMSSLLPSSDFGRTWSSELREQSVETIELRRLDSVYDELTDARATVRPFLKLDTQGSDLRVFAGAGAVLDQVVAMQSEVSCVPIYEGMPRLPEQLKQYEAAGFETVGIFVVSRDRPTMRAIEFDIVMVRPDQLRRRAAE